MGEFLLRLWRRQALSLLLHCTVQREQLATKTGKHKPFHSYKHAGKQKNCEFWLHKPTFSMETKPDEPSDLLSLQHTQAEGARQVHS